MHFFVLVAYNICIAGLLYFALYRGRIMWLAFRGHRESQRKLAPLKGPLPNVCIQCPCYNEPLVIAGLLETVTAIRWDGPLEIQILDDSSDTTSEIISNWLLENPVPGTHIRHIRRENRVGYKAGALNAGLSMSDAPFIAIFDADFRPEPDFLERLMPHFSDPRIGVVQARWEFCNRRTSLLTWLQAMVLDIHFVLEQTARSQSELFFNFNGTAGIWRRHALDDGGGWSADTVTEDLDLSYRAQLAGWRFVYTPDYAVTSELPENITGFKSQQRRWTKGGVQVARRLLGRVLQSREPLSVKSEAVRHLTIGVINPIMTAFCLTQLGYIAIADLNHLSTVDVVSGIVVMACSIVSIWSFWLAQKLRSGARRRDAIETILRFPALTVFSVGLSITYTVAFIEGLLAQKPGEFVRTPKGGSRVHQEGLLKQLKGRGLLHMLASAEVISGVLATAFALNFLINRHVHGVIPTIRYVLSITAASVLAVSFISIGAISIMDMLGWNFTNPQNQYEGTSTVTLQSRLSEATPVALPHR